MLSGGTAFRDDEIGMTRSNPHSGQLFEPVRDDTEFARQVWNPPFMFLEQIVAT